MVAALMVWEEHGTMTIMSFQLTPNDPNPSEMTHTGPRVIASIIRHHLHCGRAIATVKRFPRGAVFRFTDGVTIGFAV